MLFSFCERFCTCGGDICKLLFGSTKHFSVLHTLWCKLWMVIFYYSVFFFFFVVVCFCFPLNNLCWGFEARKFYNFTFIRYENSDENIKIETDHKIWNFIEINQHCRGSCHLSFCSDAIFRAALLIPCKMILSKNSAARKRAGACQHISLQCIHCYIEGLLYES